MRKPTNWCSSKPQATASGALRRRRVARPDGGWESLIDEQAAVNQHTNRWRNKMRSEEVQRYIDADDAYIEFLKANRDVFANAVKAVISASGDYLPPDGISKDEFINRVLGATDNAEIVAALEQC